MMQENALCVTETGLAIRIPTSIYDALTIWQVSGLLVKT